MLVFLAIDQLKTSQSVSTVATQTGISASSIFRRMTDIEFPKPSRLPQILSIDEFKGNAGDENFQSILTNPNTQSLRYSFFQDQIQFNKLSLRLSNQKRCKIFCDGYELCSQRHS